MAKHKQLVLAFFDTEAAAQTAADSLTKWDKANKDVKAGAVGVLVKDDKGNVKQELLGPRAAGKGAGIGLILGIIAAIPTGGLSLLAGVAGGAVGGGIIGAFFHKHLGLKKEDLERIGKEFDGGKAAVGVLVPDDEAAAFTAKLAELGGKPEAHQVSAEGEEQVAAVAEKHEVSAAAPAAAAGAAVASAAVSEQVKFAGEAWIYGYPFVYGLDELAKFPAGTATLIPGGGVHPFNQFGNARELLGPDAKFVSPNNDTLYTLAPFDVSVGPVELHVPGTQGRYYVLQFIDAWSNNFAYIGRRATGTDEAKYLFVPWGWKGDVPAGIKDVVYAPTNVGLIGGRIQVHGEPDAPAVHTLQDQFTLKQLDPNAAPKGIPKPDARVSGDLVWWEKLRVYLAAFPPPDEDAPFLAILDKLGVTAKESPYINPDPALAQTLVAGAKAAQAQLEQFIKAGGAPPVNGWRSAAHLFDYNRFRLGIGTIDSDEWKIADAKKAYVTRAVAARLGLWGNHGYEADYFLVFTDADNQQLTGDHKYALRLPSAPPVDAFWSLTMYNIPEFYLVANPINRYSIGSATPGLVTAADGSITLYMQKDSPGADKESNWLPAPAGPFRPIMRMYAPKKEVFDGTYVLPAIKRVE